jgi:hemolysin III
MRELKENYNIKMVEIDNPLKVEKYKNKLEKKNQNRIKNEAPKRRIIEEIGNSITHGVGALIGIVLLILMLKFSNSSVELASAIIYGSCIIMQMAFSSMYHAFKYGSRVKRIFRRFDYSAIYLLLGGTFTPLYLLFMHNTWPILAYVLFGIMWVLIIFGLTMVAIFGPGRLRFLHYFLFFGIGWAGVIFIPLFLKTDIRFLLWILGGGLAYTLGMIPFALFNKKNTAHFIWHFMSMAGTFLQWVGIFLFIFYK